MASDNATASDISNLSLNDPPTSQPNVTTSAKWVDVTEDILSACKSLPIGGMAHAPTFSLFDSMTANEIMAPKMDSGLNPTAYVSVADRLKNGSLPSCPGRMDEVVDIVKEMFVLQAQYFDGNPLPQTMHTCLYMHRDALAAMESKLPTLVGISLAEEMTSQTWDPQSTEELLLGSFYVYCVSVLRVCAYAREVIMTADVYQDEDFATSTFGLGLGPSLNPEQFRALIVATQSAIEKWIASNPTEDEKYSVAGGSLLLHCITVNLSFADAGEFLNQPQLEGFPDAINLLELALKEHQAVKQSNLLANDLANTKVKEDEKETQDGKVESDAPGGCAEYAFEPVINFLLLTPIPPRTIPPISLRESLDRFGNTLQSLRNLCDIVKSKSLFELHDFITTWATSDPIPCSITRSRLVTLLYDEKELVIGAHLYPELIKENMAHSGIPRTILELPNTSLFIGRLVKPVYDILYVFGTNSARRRRKLVHVLDDWGGLFLEADQLDLDMESMELPEGTVVEPGQEWPPTFRYLSHYVKEWTLRLMILHLSLGFKLELYAPHELASVFWYLDFLYRCAIDQRRQLESHLEQLRNEYIESLNAVSKKKGKKKGKTPKKPLPASYRRHDYLQREQLMIAIHRTLVSGNLKFIAALKTLQRLKDIEMKFSEPSVLYNNRFHAFSRVVSPPMLTYEQFERTFDFAQFPASRWLDGAGECWTQAKEYLSDQIKQYKVHLRLAEAASDAVGPEAVREISAMIAELSSLLKVSVVSNLTLVQERARKEGDGKRLVVKLNTSYHESLPVIQLQQVTDTK